ncbi:MAG: M20/M25/M40 family metallo-hydrolase [Chloroflexota bacterium]
MNNVVKLTQELVAMPSPSYQNNVAISEFLKTEMETAGFMVEWVEYRDDNNERKVSLIGKKGEIKTGKKGGIGFFGHSDTVPPGTPGDGVYWEPFTPIQENGRIIGRGSCDMKGPVAASIIAGAQVDAAQLNCPIYVIVTADEEQGYGGAKQVVEESKLLAEGWPDYVIVCEPTEMEPVYAHKGGTHVSVVAHGVSAHTSTEKGTSSNFLIAPFLAEMAELRTIFMEDKRFQNDEFTPPTNGFNMVLNDGGTASNVTAARTQCRLSLRRMPNDNIDIAVGMIMERAAKYNLEVSTKTSGPFYVERDADVVKLACAASGVARGKTVPFGTEAVVYQDYAQTVVMGPGNIAQAHTIGEWVDVGQLERAVEVYGRLIEQVCL